MRRLLSVSILLLSACATAPQEPEPQIPLPTTPQRREPVALIGLSPNEVAERFGQPALQIREGNSLKLQFRGPRCVLDAYFYPSQPGSQTYRVTHVDTRAVSGNDISQTSCIGELDRSN